MPTRAGFSVPPRDPGAVERPFGAPIVDEPPPADAAPAAAAAAAGPAVAAAPLEPSFWLLQVFLLLMYLRPVELFLPSLWPYRPMLIVSLLMLAVAVARRVRTGESAGLGQHLQVFSLFLFSIFLSLLLTGYVGGAVQALVSMSFTVIVFIAILYLVTDMRRLKITAMTVVVCMAAQSAVGITSYHTGFMVKQLVLKQGLNASDDTAEEADESDIPAESTSGSYFWRLHSVGFLSDPNDFGQALVSSLPLLIGLWVQARAATRLLLLAPMAGAILYAINLTHSRGALLGIASIVFFGLKRWLGPVKATMLLAAGALGASAMQFAGGRAMSASEESAGGRIDAWSAGLVMLRGRPLSGVGFGNFLEYHYYTAHNTFVLCAAEVGMFGLFAWLGLLVLAFRRMARVQAAVPPGSEAARWLQLNHIALVSFLVCAFFLSRTYEPPLYVTLALCLAAAHSGLNSAPPPVAEGLRQPLPWKKLTLGVEVVGLVTIWVIVVVKTLTVGKSI